MQHMGDLQPFGPPDYLADRAPLGSYSAKRSRWRFAVGSLEVGFDRASEQIHADTLKQARPVPRTDFGRRLMILVGTLTTAVILVGLGGWLWSERGSLLGGETVSAAIIDRGDAIPQDKLTPGAASPTLIPTATPPVRLTAVIEQRKPAPSVAPAPSARVQIAEGMAIQPKPAPETGKAGPSPDEAIVASGNFLLIPSVDRAVGQAMASGEAQNWAAGKYHGLVVVGDADVQDGKSCRQGTVLLRDETTQGRTQKFERCAAVAPAKKG